MVRGQTCNDFEPALEDGSFDLNIVDNAVPLSIGSRHWSWCELSAPRCRLIWFPVRSVRKWRSKPLKVGHELCTEEPSIRVSLPKSVPFGRRARASG